MPKLSPAEFSIIADKLSGGLELLNVLYANGTYEDFDSLIAAVVNHRAPDGDYPAATLKAIVPILADAVVKIRDAYVQADAELWAKDVAFVEKQLPERQLMAKLKALALALGEGPRAG